MNEVWSRFRIQLETWDEAYGARSQRERILIAAMLVGTVFFVLDSQLVQTASAERKRVNRALTSTTLEIENLRAEVKKMGEPVYDPATEAIRKESSRLRTQLREIDKRIDAEISEMVPPDQMIPVLENLLTANSGLKLVRLETLPARKFGDPEESSENEAKPYEAVSGRTLYHHGLQMEFEGSYGATFDYLDRIEQAPWNLLWDRLDFRVDVHPNASIIIDLHTISEAEEWLGV